MEPKHVNVFSAKNHNSAEKKIKGAARNVLLDRKKKTSPCLMQYSQKTGQFIGIQKQWNSIDNPKNKLYNDSK